jgi:hypothetical protein
MQKIDLSSYGSFWLLFKLGPRQCGDKTHKLAFGVLVARRGEIEAV